MTVPLAAIEVVEAVTVVLAGVLAGVEPAVENGELAFAAL
jgi:hypothetical protein